MNPLLAIASAVLIALGVLFFVAGVVGLLRFPDTLSRLHALTKADNVGLGLIVIGLLPRAEGIGGVLRLLVIWGLVLLSSAAVGPMLARLAQARDSAE